MNGPRQRRVYLSSTYQDLVEFRRKTGDALEKIGYDIVGMEGYVASDARPLDKCLADVKACDVYVGLFAWRYGFVPPGYDLSITELEYRQASESGKERLIFLTRDDAQWPVSQIERAAMVQVDRLRNELRLAHVVGAFSTPDELATEVVTAITAAAKRRLDTEIETLRAGQAEADRHRPHERQRVVNLPPLEVSRFVDRLAEREALRGYVHDGGPRMVKVVGRAGVGKSALVSRVLGELEARLRDAPDGDASLPDGLLYLSARSTGLGLERLQSDAIRLLAEEDQESLAEAWKSRDATVEQKVETLLAALRDGRYILVLDAADVVIDDDLTIVEPGLRAFVEACLRQSGAPLLVLTSRVDVSVPPEALASVRILKVAHGLAPEDASALLRDLDPQGELGLADAPPEQLARAATITAGIPRALELLAGILQRDPASNLEQLLADEQALGAQTVEDLVAEGYRRLDSTERKVMHALAVLRRPVPAAAVAYLLHPWFPGIDVAASLRHLVSGYFVTGNRRTGEFELQALDRDHAYREIPESQSPRPADVPEYGRTALEVRAADFYASVRKPAEQWLSLADVAPQLAEISHCIRAGAFDRALEVLQPIDEHHLALWGHYLRLIELRTSLLDKPVRPRLQAANLAGLAACYQVLGRYDEAVRHFKEAARIAHEPGDADDEIAYVGNLGRVYRHLGLMDDAVRCLQQALSFYEKKGDRRGVGIWSDRVAYGYWNLGRLADAIELGTRAVAIAREVGDHRTEAAALSNLGLMHETEGSLEAAKAHQAESLIITRQVGDRRGEAIVLGRLGAIALGSGDHADALELHAEALTIAEAISDRREQSYQLFGLGRARAGLGDLTGAAQQLGAARSLEVPETSYLASLWLAMVALRGADLAAAGAAFDDAVRRSRERLARSDRLFAARYALGTALVGLAVSAYAASDDEHRTPAIELASHEYQLAVANCPGRGIVTAVLRAVDELRAGRAVVDLEACTEPLRRVLDSGP